MTPAVDLRKALLIGHWASRKSMDYQATYKDSLRKWMRVLIILVTFFSIQESLVAFLQPYFSINLSAHAGKIRASFVLVWGAFYLINRFVWRTTYWQEATTKLRSLAESAKSRSYVIRVTEGYLDQKELRLLNGFASSTLRIICSELELEVPGSQELEMVWRKERDAYYFQENDPIIFFLDGQEIGVRVTTEGMVRELRIDDQISYHQRKLLSARKQLRKFEAFETLLGIVVGAAILAGFPVVSIAVGAIMWVYGKWAFAEGYPQRVKSFSEILARTDQIDFAQGLRSGIRYIFVVIKIEF